MSNGSLRIRTMNLTDFKIDAVVWYAKQTDPIQIYTARVSEQGEFSFTWDENNTISKPTDEQIEAKAKEIMDGIPLMMLRKHRNARLQETDWMANSDVTMSDAWKTYRQALRDLPANTSDPANPTYPTKPE